MKRKWNRWRDRVPRLSRKGRIVRNIILVLAVLAVLPWLLDWPTQSSKAAFRRLEREALLSPSEIVLQAGDAFLTEGEDWVTVGQVEEYDTAWKPFQRKMAYINHVLPKGELIVAALPEVEDGVLAVAVTGLPENAASGKLSLTISRVESGWEEIRLAAEETFTDQSLRAGDWMFFSLASHSDHQGLYSECLMNYLWKALTMGYGVAPYPYTLELRDGDGESIGVYSGTLPPDLHFLRSDG